MLLWGGALLLTGVAVLGVASGLPATIGITVAGLAMVGAGLGLQLQTWVVQAQTGVPRARLGSLSGLIIFARFTGAAIVITVLGAAWPFFLRIRHSTAESGQILAILAAPENAAARAAAYVGGYRFILLTLGLAALVSLLAARTGRP